MCVSTCAIDHRLRELQGRRGERQTEKERERGREMKGGRRREGDGEGLLLLD